MTLYKWSQTAANNATADATINWAEGQAPSTVNDSARAEMAAVAKYRDDTAGTLTTGGTSTAYTLTSNEVFDTLAHMNGQCLKVRFNATNGAAPTLNVDALGAKPIQVDTATAVGTGVIKANSIWDVTYDNSAAAFILSGVPAAVQDGTVASASLAAGSVGTTALAASAVTYAKIQNLTNATLLGNNSGSAAAPSEITLGTNMSFSGTTIQSLPAMVPGAYKNLSIKVATNTTVACASDYVALTDGTNFLTVAVGSGTINMGTSGALNTLDTGTIAAATWYAIWAIAKADGSLPGYLASTSFTAPTMPSGYTLKARVGAVTTASGLAQLMGTWQFGRWASYIYGLAQTTSNVVLASGSAGSVSVPTWVAVSVTAAVPTTASRIAVKIRTAGATVIVAPNNSYGGSSAAVSTGPPLEVSGSTTVLVSENMLLESTSIYWASDNASQGIVCLGWEDNI